MATLLSLHRCWFAKGGRESFFENKQQSCDFNDLEVTLGHLAVGESICNMNTYSMRLLVLTQRI